MSFRTARDMHARLGEEHAECGHRTGVDRHLQREPGPRRIRLRGTERRNFFEHRLPDAGVERRHLAAHGDAGSVGERRAIAADVYRPTFEPEPAGVADQPQHRARNGVEADLGDAFRPGPEPGVDPEHARGPARLSERAAEGRARVR